MRFSARACPPCSHALVNALLSWPAVHRSPPVIWGVTALVLGTGEVLAKATACRGCAEDVRELLANWRARTT